ncbi:MAG TPA: transporter substrate-binding domain-containing protein [Thermoanaerobaculia bacterium]|nr:transporter substrate-binding domain-containing protein [Thermoanaerobaculia bacterium]
MRRCPAALGAVLLGLATATAGAAPPENARLANRIWRVGIFEAPPYTWRAENGEWRGLLVELWKEVANELNLSYRLGEANADTILDDLAHDRLDVAIAPFAVTLDRERTVDFTHGFLRARTGIAVRRGGDEERWTSVARALATPTALRLYLGIVFLVFLAGVLIWLLERRRNPEFGGRASQGIGSGVWWSGVTTVAVGYGDKVPITFWGRVTGLLWMSISLILVTAFTAFVTAKLAVAEFGRVVDAQTLRNGIVGTVEGAAVGELLRHERIRHRVYASIPKALDALREREVAAVVWDVTVLDYYVQRDARRDLEVLPSTFDHQILAFPVPDGSPLRDPIDGVLRRFLALPGWQDLQDRYLAAARPDARER